MFLVIKLGAIWKVGAYQQGVKIGEKGCGVCCDVSGVVVGAEDDKTDGLLVLLN